MIAEIFSNAKFILHDLLKDFLKPNQRGFSVSLTFREHQSVKHLFESLGVPHTEVSYAIVDGLQVDFSYQVQDGDEIEIFPMTIKERKHQASMTGGAFLLDMHLGKLASYLRIMGFDTLYRNDYSDEELGEIASQAKRILLTRDRRLLMRRQIELGYCVRTLEPARQVVEVLDRFDLRESINPFKRCPKCNGMLEVIEKSRVIDRLEPLTKRYFNVFHICVNCSQIYWKGSHYERILDWIHTYARISVRPESEDL
jgi:uncharacterized protein with PIN domain